MALPDSASSLTLTGSTTLTYTLTNDNPSNTSFISGPTEYAKPIYNVHTKITDSQTLTTVTDEEGVFIASLEWRDVLPDRVVFKDKPSTSLNSWMKSGLLPNSAVSFQDDSGRRYQWRNVAAGLNMELYANDTPGGPIALFRKSRVNPIANTSMPATFSMTARAQEIPELCVVSFLFLEKKRRMRENSSQNRADVLGSAPLTEAVHKGGV